MKLLFKIIILNNVREIFLYFECKLNSNQVQNKKKCKVECKKLINET